MAGSTNALQPGELFAARYQVKRLLGRGAMGAVYLVHDGVLDVDVALKVLSVEPLADEQALPRFRREVRLARQITHRNVVRIHDIGTCDDITYYTMQWVEGEGLDQLIARSGRIDQRDALDLSLQIVRGLGAAHAHGVIHRDLKPSNVMIEQSGRVVLTDFGIARSLLGDVDATLTRGVLGTPQYMAPEQITGASIAATADLYATGGVLYEMLTGQPPFSGKTPLATAIARLDQPPPDPRELVAIDEAVAELTLCCLARDPAERPQSADALIDAIERCLASIATGKVVVHSDDGSAGSDAGVGDTIVTSKTARARERLGALMRGRAIAVLPFRLNGPTQEQYLADGLTEELIDVLSRMRGMQVFASNATAQFAENRAPQRLGRELGADLVVDATLRRAGDKVRITARLVDAQTGLQQWSQVFDGRFSDVFALQETMGARIAEALRVELSLRDTERPVPVEALEPYLRARQLIRLGFHSSERATELLERALELAPDFGPALATHARAAVFRWFVYGYRVSGYQQAAHQSVERALVRVPHLVESQLAAGALAAQLGDYTAAVMRIKTALDIAPTCVDALTYLGMLECEAGRNRLGVPRLQLSLRLDPASGRAVTTLARHHALAGDRAAYDELVARFPDTDLAEQPSRFIFESRMAAWFGDVETMREKVAQLPSTLRVTSVMQMYLATLEKTLDGAQLRALLDSVEIGSANPRMLSLAFQISTEMLCLAGAPDAAATAMDRAVAEALLDVAWLDGCPLLEPLRRDRRFGGWRERTQRRAAQIWS